MSLRKVIALLSFALVMMAVLSFVGMAYLTSASNQSIQLVMRSLTSVRAAEEIQQTLIEHDHARKSLAANGRTSASREMELAEATLHHWLAVAKSSIENETELQVVNKTEAAINAYLAEARDLVARPGLPPEAPLLIAANDAAEQLIHLNLEFAERAKATAEVWHVRAGDVRVGIIVLILLVAISVPLWLERRLYRPFQSLLGTLGQRAAGESQARAALAGPTEFREIAASYNAMADSLDRQRQNQLSYLAALAHELRTPLTAMKLNVAHIARSEEPIPAELARDRLAVVGRQVDRIEALVRDLMDVSRIEAGRFTLEQQELDLRALAADAVALFKDTSQDHALHFSSPDTSVQVLGDSGRLSQVLNNLLSNAIKYSPLGGRIDVRVRSEAERAVVEVSDQGIGISAEDLGQLFEPFRRVGKTKGSIPGIGLGLSVSRRLIQAHGGDIGVTSELGRGTTFRVVLPLAEAQARMEPRAEA